jgi:hypothetical protein
VAPEPRADPQPAPDLSGADRRPRPQRPHAEAGQARIGGPQDRPLYEKRFPQVYSDPARNAIQSIPLRAILPFLSEPLVVDDADDIRAGIVVATQEGRVFTSPGDTIFATRINPEISNWNVYRKARPSRIRSPVSSWGSRPPTSARPG